MKKIALFGLVATLLGGGFISTASAQVRIGTVDMKRVFDSYYKTKDAEQQVNEQRNKVRKELEDRLENYKKAVSEIQRLDDDIKRPEISAIARDGKQKERSEKVARINKIQQDDGEFRTKAEKDLQDLSMRLRADIMKDIDKVVADRVKAEQYDLVFDRTGPSLNNVPVVMYAKESYDFTTDVVTALNKLRGTAAAPAVRPPDLLRPTEAARPVEVARPVATPTKKPK